MAHTSSAVAQVKFVQVQPQQHTRAGDAPASAPQERGGIGAMPTTLNSGYDKMPLHEQYDLALNNSMEFMRIVDSVPYRKDLVERNPSYKTQICPSFNNPDFICRVGDACAYAMSLFEQVRYCTERHPLWRSKVCEHLKQGKACPFKVCLAGHPGSLMRTFEKVVDYTTNKSMIRCTGFYILDHKAVKMPNDKFPVRYINVPPAAAAPSYSLPAYAPLAFVPSAQLQQPHYPAGYAPVAPSHAAQAPQPQLAQQPHYLARYAPVAPPHAAQAPQPQLAQQPHYLARYAPVAPSHAAQAPQPYFVQQPQYTAGYAPVAPSYAAQQQQHGPVAPPQYVQTGQIAPFAQPSNQPVASSHALATQQFSPLPAAALGVMVAIPGESRDESYNSTPAPQQPSHQGLTTKISSPRPIKPELASILNESHGPGTRAAVAPAHVDSRPLGSLKKPGYMLPPDVKDTAQKPTKQLLWQKKK